VNARPPAARLRIVAGTSGRPPAGENAQAGRRARSWRLDREATLLTAANQPVPPLATAGQRSPRSATRRGSTARSRPASGRRRHRGWCPGPRYSGEQLSRWPGRDPGASRFFGAAGFSAGPRGNDGPFSSTTTVAQADQTTGSGQVIRPDPLRRAADSGGQLIAGLNGLGHVVLRSNRSRPAEPRPPRSFAREHQLCSSDGGPRGSSRSARMDLNPSRLGFHLVKHEAGSPAVFPFGERASPPPRHSNASRQPSYPSARAWRPAA